MKKFVIFVVGLMAFALGVPSAYAADKDGVSAGFTLGAPGCFEYQLTPDKVLIINTAAQLLIDKDAVVAVNKAQVEQLCTPEGKALYGRLMKIGPVAGVRIAARSLAVLVHPFPPNAWDSAMPLALKEIKETLDCKK